MSEVKPIDSEVFNYCHMIWIVLKAQYKKYFQSLVFRQISNYSIY